MKCEKGTERAVSQVVSLNEVQIESVSAARLEVLLDTHYHDWMT